MSVEVRGVAPFVCSEFIIHHSAIKGIEGRIMGGGREHKKIYAHQKTKKAMFDHFILTSFNIRRETGALKGHPGLDEGWLKRRFDLFEHGCVPSMVRQTEKSFKWLIFFDSATPEKYVKRMDELSLRYPYIIPIYCEEFNEPFAVKEVNLRSTSGHLRIMTNLDNDDFLHPEMVGKIQDMAKAHYETNDLERGFFINFPFGYSVQDGDYYLMRFRYNPFNSFVSVPEYKKTILGWDHTKIIGVAPILFDYTWPMWCQVIHGENLCNTKRGLYWPWGKHSAWLKGKVNDRSRPLAWQVSEFYRSFKSYFLGR